MADIKACFLPLLATAAFLFAPVQSSPSPTTTQRSPPPLPKYYPVSVQRPSSSPHPPTSSLAPTSPVFTAQRIRPSDQYSAEYDDPYPAGALLGTARTTSGVASGDEDYAAPPNTGFVEPIDFSSLLKDVGSSPKGVGLEIGASNSNPLFASESKDTFQGFFGSTKNPFEELSRLNTASSNQNTRGQNGEEENIGFVDPNVQFRSLFDSAGPSSASTGFKPEDFLGSKSENLPYAASKGSQTRAYPSFTYSGRQNDEPEREDSDGDYYGGGGNSRPSGNSNNNNRYRSSYRQVGPGNGGGGGGGNYFNSPPSSDASPDYYNSPPGGPGGDVGPYDEYDRSSYDSPSDSYDDGPQSSYYAASPGPPQRSNAGYERATPRYAPAESSNSPQSKPRTAESNKSPRCKKVEKTVDYSDDHASFTDPEPDYDPSTYQGRYKRQARQRGGRGGNGGGGAPRRPMTCYVCEDEHGRYAEKCSYDSKGSPSKDGNYFHSESSSYSDNGRRPSSGKSKERNRRTPASSGSNRQRASYTAGDDAAGAESTTKPVAIKPENLAEIGESEPKVIEKRQSGGGFGRDDEGEYGGNNRDEYRDPYDASSGNYQRPTGYEGPPLSSIGGAQTNRGGYHGGGGGGGGGYHGGNNHGDGDGFHSSGGGGGRGYHGGGGRGGGGRGGNDDGFDSDFERSFGAVPDYEREAAQATREYDFTIPREFDPDVQLGPNEGGRGGQPRGGGGGGGGRNAERAHGPGGPPPPQFSPQYYHNPNRRGGGQQASASNRRDALDDFEIGYNDYVKNNFPEAFSSPGFSSEGTSASPGFNPSNYEFTPNYYHRPRNNEQQGNSRGPAPEVSHSSPSDNYGRRPSYGHGHGGHGGHGGGDREHRGDRDRGRGGYTPHKEHTQPRHQFSPPPGFFSETSDSSPAFENYGQVGDFIKEFSTKSRGDGCQRVNKGDMTCWVCRDAKGMKKEECAYASNDPKNKAVAYHEVAEYSSPTAAVLPAPLHATLLGIAPSSEDISSIEGDDSTLSAQASEVVMTSTPPAKTTEENKEPGKLESSASTTKKLVTRVNSASDKKESKPKHVSNVKSTRVIKSSTVIVHERSKRDVSQEKKGRRLKEETKYYDFDY